jgi:hypothetical protein
MKNNNYRSPVIALCLTLFASLTAFAQSEKIAIKMAPEPNQTIRMRSVQDLEINISFEGESFFGNALPEPAKVLAKTVFGLTQKVGAPDKDGNITSELIYDEVSSEITMNGQPTLFGDAVRNFIGKKVLTTFNKMGEMIDIKIPPDLGLSEEAFKKMLKAFYGDLSQTAIGMGEVVTTPFDFTVPIPIPGAPALKVDGQIKYKLNSVEKGATGRIAKFNQTVDGKLVNDMELPLPTGKVKMNVDFNMNGGGDTVMNVDKGRLESSNSNMTFGGKLNMAHESSEIKFPTINIQGALKSTVTVAGTN